MNSISSGIYIVATPIGNLDDITVRALNILKSVDVVFCEDKRTTSILLTKYNIKNKLSVYNDYSDEGTRNKIFSALLRKDIKSVALVCDAGTPMINDPGYKLVKESYVHNIKIFPIPGACSPIAALMGSGLPTDKFLYQGFFPLKNNEKKNTVQEIKNNNITNVFLESPNRILKTLKFLNDEIDAEIVIAREITKTFEEFLKGNSQEVYEKVLKKYEKNEKIKGEIILLIKNRENKKLSNDDIIKMVIKLKKDYKLKDAVKIVSKKTKLSNSEIYNMVISVNK